MFDYILAWLYTHDVMPKSEKGQDLAEYALLLGLIALIVIVAVTLLGRNISTVFSRLASATSTWF